MRPTSAARSWSFTLHRYSGTGRSCTFLLLSLFLLCLRASDGVNTWNHLIVLHWAVPKFEGTVLVFILSWDWLGQFLCSDQTTLPQTHRWGKMLICFLKQSKWVPNSLCKGCFVPVVLAQVPQQPFWAAAVPWGVAPTAELVLFFKASLNWVQSIWGNKPNKSELRIVLPVSCFACRCRCPVRLGTSPTSFLHNLWSSSWFPPLPLPRWGGSRVKMQLLWSTMTCSVQSPSWAQVGTFSCFCLALPFKSGYWGSWSTCPVLWEETWVSFMWCFLVVWNDPSLSLLNYLIDWKCSTGTGVWGSDSITPIYWILSASGLRNNQRNEKFSLLQISSSSY